MQLTNRKSAEQAFREAFERLKCNKPQILAKGSAITQNNVAREAERDPSALKKDRYPILILEIQQYLESKKERKKGRVNDNRSRSLKQRLSSCQKQRDKLNSIVIAQDEFIQELLNEIAQLKEGNVLSFEK